MLVRLASGRIPESGPVHVRASGPSGRSPEVGPDQPRTFGISEPAKPSPRALIKVIGGLSPIALCGLTTLYSRRQASTFWHQSTGFDSGSSRVRELSIK